MDDEYRAYCVTNTQDDYSKCVVDFTEAWVALMEPRLATGEALADIYGPTSHEAGRDFGLTGFQYGCAVQSLARFWVHGEALAALHNAEYGAAGAEGVVNPAVITLDLDGDVTPEAPPT